MKKNYIIVLVLLLTTAMLLPGCGKKPASANSRQDTEKPIAVTVARVTNSTVESLSALSGKVKPVQEVSIVPKIPGKVARINFEVGDRVKAGDVLFTLDDSDIKLQLNQAEAALALAKSGAKQQVSQLKAALVAAETGLNDARLNYDRTKQLFETGAVSRQGLEAAETRLKVAEEQYKSAKTSYDLTQSGTNSESITSTEAQIKQAQAAYDIAKSQLDNTVVKSPISGIVASRNIDIGELVSNAMAAMSVVDISSVTIDINVPESMINKIHQNDSVEVIVRSVSEAPMQGQIISISPAVDQRTQNYPVKIKVANENSLLKGGMFAEIKLKTDKAEKVLAVPLSSIVDDSGKKFVFVVNGDQAEKREVAIGFSNDTSVQILSGLKENETIVVKGQNLLRDGSKVTVVEK